MRLLPLVAIALALAACGRPTPPPDRYTVLRTYGWETTVGDPQAEWNPTSYQVLARADGGFVLLDEGAGRQQYYSSLERRELHHPAWINGHQFVFGPRENVLRNGATIVPNSDGLQVVTIAGSKPIATKPLANAGVRPRRWKDQVVAQVEDRLICFDRDGKQHPFGQGFWAEPQPEGKGLCYQQTPVLETDHWTAKPRLGALVIRWKPGSVTIVPAAIQPRWTADGGVVAVVLKGEPPKDGAWWSVGTELVHLSGPGATPKTIARDVHDPDPHPLDGTVAATANDGRLVLIDLAGRPQAVLADHGDRPRWSSDGLRLMVEEPLLTTKPDAKAGRYLRVYVLSATAPR